MSLVSFALTAHTSCTANIAAGGNVERRVQGKRHAAMRRDDVHHEAVVSCERLSTQNNQTGDDISDHPIVVLHTRTCDPTLITSK